MPNMSNMSNASALSSISASLLLLLSGCVGTGLDPVLDELEVTDGQAKVASASSPTSAKASSRLHAKVPFEQSALNRWAKPKSADLDGWPEASAFKANFNHGTPRYNIVECGASTLLLTQKSLIEGYGGEKHDVQMAIVVESGEQSEVLASLSSSTSAFHHLFFEMKMKLQPTRQAGAPRVYESKQHGVSLTCSDPQVTTPTSLDPESFSAYTYTQTLLHLKEPLYVPPREEELNQEQKAKVQALWSDDPLKAQDVQWLLETNPREAPWAKVIAWAKQNNEVELAYEAYRRFRPRGRCSRDRYPLVVKRQFASFCSKHGKLSCQMRLMTDLLAYRGVSRMSDMWVGGKPVSYQSPFDAMKPLVELDTYILGSLLEYPATGKRAEITPHFYALAIEPSNLNPIVESRPTSTPPNVVRHLAILSKLLAKGELDPWNAHLVGLAWASIRHRGSNEKEMMAELETLPGVRPITVAMVKQAILKND